MQEKKESSSIANIFIYLLIVVLILLIAAPPLCRVFFKEEKSKTNTNTANNITSATALTCRKEVVVGTMIYNVSITSNYGNDILNKVTFTYEQPEVVDPNVIDNPVLTEMNNLRNSGLVTEETTETTSTFILTKSVKEANPTNTTLDSFFQPLDAQETNLESLGYNCSTLTA